MWFWKLPNSCGNLLFKSNEWEPPQSDHIEKQLSLMSSMFIMSTQLSSIYQLRHYHVPRWWDTNKNTWAPSPLRSLKSIGERQIGSWTIAEHFKWFINNVLWEHLQSNDWFQQKRIMRGLVVKVGFGLGVGMSRTSKGKSVKIGRKVFLRQMW